jgi:hypothetical protein
MIRTQASSLVLALLRFIGTHNEALAGDLAEEWRAGRSSAWLCRQLFRAAIVTALGRHVSRGRAARLLAAAVPYSEGMQFRLIDPATMNLRGFRVASVGGGGLLGAVLLITIAVPQAWVLVLVGLTGGLIIGAATIMWRRDRGLAGPIDSAPLSLFHSADDDGQVSRPRTSQPDAVQFMRV